MNLLKLLPFILILLTVAVGCSNSTDTEAENQRSEAEVRAWVIESRLDDLHESGKNYGQVNILSWLPLLPVDISLQGSERVWSARIEQLDYPSDSRPLEYSSTICDNYLTIAYAPTVERCLSIIRGALP